MSATQASHTKHMRLHTNDKPYICELCPKRFMWHSSMLAHSRSHTRGRTRIISNQKGETQHGADGMANATNTLVVEQQSPSANKRVTKDEAASGDTLRVPFPAQEAAEAFPQKSDQDLAAKSDLSSVEGRKLETTAGPGIEQQVTLPSQTKSGLVSQGFQCNFCDKVSMTKHKHRRHVRRHTADFPYSCKLCPKKFKWHSSLSAHSKSHATGKWSKMTTKVPDSPQKGFKCHICNKVSRDSSRHRRHMRLHTGDTPYSCHLCPKKFKWCSSLAAHFKSHENERLRGQVHESHELTAGGMTVKGKETSDGINCDDEDGLQNIPSDGDAPYRALSDEKGMSKAGQHEEDSDIIGSRDVTSVSRSGNEDISQHPVCDICLKPCFSKRKLKEHMASHDEPFAFSCDMCGRRFKWLHFLEVHKRSHMRDREDEEKN
ncbi:zinc finger Y-chromosomal protein-like [Diadema antillarum]|uniref:zinc finger Y-chromosomal protein-like n=1 Tax=Diadema antillarum TaxID=105358 RepID=UPI003A8B9D9E